MFVAELIGTLNFNFCEGGTILCASVRRTIFNGYSMSHYSVILVKNKKCV